MTQGTVVVGLDDSQAAQAALDWAVERAARRGVPLELVHAADVWPYDARGVAQVPGSAAHALVEAAAERVRARVPGLEVTTRVAASSPSALLLARATGDEPVVVGARGRGGFPALHLGSVGSQVAAHAEGPVVVVRPGPGTGTVVGVDGSPTSDRAVGFAFEEAAGHGEPLVAVHAWLPVYAGLAEVPQPEDVQPPEGELQALLSEQLSGWCEQYPDVEVRQLVHALHPVPALQEASRTARLLVVGSHGRGGFRAMLLGSVSRSLLHHAACSVAVVRGPRAQDGHADGGP